MDRTTSILFQLFTLCWPVQWFSGNQLNASGSESRVSSCCTCFSLSAVIFAWSSWSCFFRSAFYESTSTVSEPNHIPTTHAHSGMWTRSDSFLYLRVLLHLGNQFLQKKKRWWEGQRRLLETTGTTITSVQLLVSSVTSVLKSQITMVTFFKLWSACMFYLRHTPAGQFSLFLSDEYVCDFPSTISSSSLKAPTCAFLIITWFQMIILLG